LKISDKDKKYLRRAIELAYEGMRAGKGGPFGAVIVKDDEIVGEGYNQVSSSNDPTAHAEVVAIRNACKNLDSFQLDDCVIYSSCEPCPMCLGAIYWARPARLLFAAGHEDADEIAGFDDQFIYKEIELPMAERNLPAAQAMREEGLGPFQEWADKQDKTLY